MFFRPLLCLSLCAFALPTLADTVWLKNGDRLTGKISVLDGGKLLIETSYGGSIPLKWNQIATLESDQKLLVKQGDTVGEVAKSLQASEPGKVTLVNGGAPRTVELASISQIIHPKPLIQDFTWKGNVDVAMDYKRAETDTDDYDVSFDTKARHGLWRHNGAASYNREYRDGVTVTDNWDAEYALDRFIDEHWFWQGRLNYKRDQIEDVRRQRTIGTGPGYQFWDNDLGAFSLAALINRSDYEFADGSEEDFYLAALKWDYNRYLVGKTFELFSSGELGKPLESVADYALDAEVGLRYKVTDWASLNIKAEKDIISGAEESLDETRYSIGFGVGW
ncbi:peptide chain release factor RF-3 [Stutzerimonas degradans]|nr:peptide chain release factor RF-3 [Stutzerimonas degradans]